MRRAVHAVLHIEMAVLSHLFGRQQYREIMPAPLSSTRFEASPIKEAASCRRDQNQRFVA